METISEMGNDVSDTSLSTNYDYQQQHRTLSGLL